jgi:sugar lactone lactonase YvrE
MTFLHLHFDFVEQFAANRVSGARGGGVFRRSPNGSIETLLAGRKMVGGIALNHGGGLIVTGATVAHWNEKSGRITDLFTQWEGKPLFGMNDLTIDDQGSLLTPQQDPRREGEYPAPGDQGGQE